MSIDEENSSVFVKISPSNKIFRVSQFAVQVVTSRTYKRATTSNLDKDNYARKETRIKT